MPVWHQGWRWERIPLPVTTYERWGWVLVTTYHDGSELRLYPNRWPEI